MPVKGNCLKMQGFLDGYHFQILKIVGNRVGFVEILVDRYFSKFSISRVLVRQFNLSNSRIVALAPTVVRVNLAVISNFPLFKLKRRFRVIASVKLRQVVDPASISALASRRKARLLAV